MSTTARNSTEKGKPKRKRILVAPQVPSGFVNDRCIALRAVCANAAMMVKGIQRLVTVSMCGERSGGAEPPPQPAGRGSAGQPHGRHGSDARTTNSVVVLAKARTTPLLWKQRAGLKPSLP